MEIQSYDAAIGSLSSTIDRMLEYARKHPECPELDLSALRQMLERVEKSAEQINSGREAR